MGDPLRFSSLGRPDRQLWFMAHPEEGSQEKVTAKTYFKFLYGDVIEALLLFLVKEAGHVVEREQEEIEVEGVKGHIDAIIDGTVVDVKSASPFGFKKFKEGRVLEEDPFGYVQQLAGYADVLTPGVGAAWLAMDKVSGDLCVSTLSSSVIDDNRPAPRIDHLREVIASDEVPALCHDPVPFGKSGNEKLPTPCSYCPFKFRCHPSLRAFAYSSGPVFLTRVVEEPKVFEIVKSRAEEIET